MSERRRPILKLLRAADTRFKRATLPPEVYRRIAAEIARATERRAGRGWWIVWTYGVVAAVAVAVVLIVVRREHEVADPGSDAIAVRTDEATAAPAILPVEAEGETCALDREAMETRLTGACRARSPAWSLVTDDEATVVARGTTIVVRRGEVTLEVEKVPAGGEPVRVEVSHGVIEVLGTKFTVKQGSRAGTVELFEGRIRFVHSTGTVTELEPGDTHVWGAASVGDVDGDAEYDVQIIDDDEIIDAAAEVAALRDEVADPLAEASTRREHGAPRGRARAPKRAVESVENAAALIAVIEELKARRDFETAARRLQAAQHRRWDSRSAQILSYELGALLAGPLGRTDAACKQFAKHERKFPGGRYQAVVRAQQSRLGCGQ